VWERDARGAHEGEGRGERKRKGSERERVIRDEHVGKREKPRG
jgi:hypothetical protein